jgi:hypothetical protein
MAGTLRFNVGEVRKLYNHSVVAKEHFASSEDLFEAKYHKGGQVVMCADMDWPDSKNIDTTLIPASLWLVRDRGVYLMSNGLPPMLVEGSETKRVAAYAKGADPQADEEWYRVKREVFGGDDGVENLPVSIFSGMMELGDEDTIKISVSQRAIKIIAEPKKVAKAKLKP